MSQPQPIETISPTPSGRAEPAQTVAQPPPLLPVQPVPLVYQPSKPDAAVPSTIKQAGQASVMFFGSVVAIFVMFALGASVQSDSSGTHISKSGAAIAILAVLATSVWLGAIAWRWRRSPQTRGYAIGIFAGLAFGFFIAAVCLIA